MYRPEDIGDENAVRCGFRDCHQCCLETEMILTDAEVEKIEKNTGKPREEFLLKPEDADGFLQLRNVESDLGKKCFFLTDKGKCSIYKFAPQGCRMYPLILNLETDETMIDIDCRERPWFAKQKYLQGQIITVKQLVSTLLLENEYRVEELGLYQKTTDDFDSLYFEDSETVDELRQFIRKMQERGDDE